MAELPEASSSNKTGERMAELPESSTPSKPSRRARFFEEDNGSLSSMRLMSFVALIAAILFGALTLTFDTSENNGTGLYITLMFLVSAFAPKAVQKFAEQKLNER
uniref:Uncharacterized protein n=1 Tax=Chlorobium chlorochromatii (strain CaD3) TaxID=340177 RepID=Q3APM9_CHLCH